MNKLRTIFLALAMVALMASTALAAPFSITFTADNVLTDFTLSTNGGPAVAVDGFSSAANLDNWRESTSMDFALTPGNSYEIIWRVENVGAPSANNPFAFMADVSMPGVNLSTSATWEVATEVDGAPSGWTTATEYAVNSGLLTDGSGNSIWFNAEGAIDGISDEAAWIGFDTYPGSDANVMYVRMNFTATPVPAAVWLMGSGLLSLIGVRRFRR